MERAPGLWTVNLGTGQGYSVLDIVKAFQQASGREIPYRIVDRRPGDVACCYADPSAAARELEVERATDAVKSAKIVDRKRSHAHPRKSVWMRT